MRRFLTSLFLLCICFTFTTEGYAFWVWTPQTGKWLNPKHAVKETPKKQFELAMSFFEKAEYKRARKECLKLIKHYPRSRYSADAQFFIGEGFALRGYHFKAFQEYQKVIDTYPYSKKMNTIIEKQFEIGKRYLSGEKYKTLGVALMPAYMKAAEVFIKVRENAPNGPHAVESLYLAGQSYIKAELANEAIEQFSELLTEYPDSAYQEKAQYAIADLKRKKTKRPDYDNKSLDNAINDFEEYLEEHPDSDFVGEANEALLTLREKKAAHLFHVAQFYEKNDKLEGALVYYDMIISDYNETTYSSIAEDRIDEIEEIIYGDYVTVLQIPKDHTAKVVEEKTVVEKEVVPSTQIRIPFQEKTTEQVVNEYSQKITSRTIASDEVIVLERFHAINYAKIAKVKLISSGSLLYAHYTLDDPFRLIIDPITPIKTTLNELTTYDKGLIKNITFVKDVKQIDVVSDEQEYYPVDYIVIEFFRKTPYELVQKDAQLIVKVGGYLSDFLTMKESNTEKNNYASN